MSKVKIVVSVERSSRDTLMRVTTVTVFICLLLSTTTNGAVNNLEIPPNAGCACPGDILTYTCTTIGGGNTIWRGSTFDCESSSNEIILRHSQFDSEGAMGSCSDGSLRAESLRIENGNCFVSQLNATVMASFNGTSIGCYHNSNAGTRTIGESVLNVVSVANPSPPQNFNLMSVSGEQVTVSWTMLTPPCPFVEYTYIISSDCGVCPPSTDGLTVTCTGFQLPTVSNSTMCTFTVNSRLCDTTGDVSAEALLRIPNVPRIQNVIPSYLNDTKELKRLLITVAKNETEAIINDVSGAISAYNLSLTTSPSGPRVSLSIDADSGSCDDNICTYTVDVPQDICMSSSNFNIALSAINSVGQGFPSDAINIGCTNEFVRLYFNATTSNFTCVFTSGINSEKTCSIRFTRGGQEPSRTVQGGSTNASVVSLDLGDIADGVYSFIVSASSGVTTVQVEGDFRIGSTASISPAIAAVAVVPVVIIGAVIVGVCLKVVYSCYRKRTHKDLQLDEEVKFTEKVDNNPFRDIKPVKVPENEAREFNLFAVQSDCSQREAMSVMKFAGDIYYELTDEKEDIFNYEKLMFTSEKKFPKIEQIDSPPVGFSATNPNAVEVIPLTQVQVAEQFSLRVFAPDVDSKALLARGLIGEGITRRAFGVKYRVFVKSEASGTRHLARGTCILYKEQEHHTQDQEPDYPLLPVPDDYMAVCNIRDDTTLWKFYKDQHIEVYKNKPNTCLELSDQIDLKDVNIRDIVLMDKGGQLFTGPGARKMLRGEELDDKHKHMNIFVLGAFDGNHELKKGTSVLYENPDHRRSTIWMLKVDKHNVRMSEFVKKKTGGFEKGQVFYEFTEKEDLPYCRKVVRLTEGQFRKAERQESQKLDVSVEVFYSSFIPGAPGMNVSPPVLERGTRIFIHDPTQGSRCLKKGTFLLYKCEDPRNGNSNNNNNAASIVIPSVEEQMKW